MPEALLENLKVSVKDAKACQKILTIEVPKDSVQKEYEVFYNAVAAKAKVPGFRPGKAPRQVLEMHFQNEAREQVIKNLISDSLRNALQANELNPLIYPKIEQVNFENNKLSYQAHIEVRPKIKLSHVKGLSVKKDSAQVEDKEIQNALQRIQESLAQYKVVEARAARMGDFVIADYVCKIGGKEMEKRSDQWFELKEEEFLKGFSAQLVGVKPGESRDVTAAFPESSAHPDVSGKTGIFHVQVKEIKEKNLPALNDDLAKEAGEYNSFAELQEKTRKDLLADKERGIEAAYEKNLLDELVKQNKIDLPQGLVQRRLDHLLDEARHRFAQQGGAEELFEREKEKFAKDLAMEAARQVHLAFLLDEIAVKENITVAEEDRKKKFEELAQRYRQPADQIEKIYSENANALESMEEQIRNEKAIQFVKANAKSK